MPRRRLCWAVLAAAFAISRLACLAGGVRFDTEPLEFYWQYIDPALLRTDFWRSLFYLEQQPPAFNFFLGGILHLVPSHFAMAFHAVYLALGLALPLSLFELMNRLGVDRRIALFIALVFTLSPSTILYENLLFYEYPLTVVFCIAALFLHRFASSGKWGDSAIFFCSLGVIAGIRSAFHWLWFAAILLILLFRFGQWRRPIIAGAAAPGLLLTAVYAKNFILFHEFTPGSEVYTGLNFTAVTTAHVERDQIERLIAAGRITPVLRTDPFHLDDVLDGGAAERALRKMVPVPPKTGIAVRDNCLKSTGWTNWNCAWAGKIVQACTRDALTVFRAFPGAYWSSVKDNLRRFFLPDTERWPFDGREDGNERILSRLLRIYNVATTGEWPSKIERPWLSYIALPGLLLYGFWRAWVLRGAAGLTLAFMAVNALYLPAIVVLFAAGDQNRYRVEVSTFFAVWLGMAASDAARLLARTKQRRAVPH